MISCLLRLLPSVNFVYQCQCPFLQCFLCSNCFRNHLCMESSLNREEPTVAGRREKQLGGSLLIITSSIHMRRALMAFEQEGIHADPFVTDCIVKVKGKESRWLPSLHVIRDWQALLHEIIGYAYYKRPTL